jgi:Redoxin
MAFRLLARRLPTTALPRPHQPTVTAAVVARRPFQTSAERRVAVGQEIPDLEVLVEDSPGNKVNLAEEFKLGNGIIVGVPAAFSGACSNSHVPSYMNHPRLADAGQVFVVSVNDAFVCVAALFLSAYLTTC